MKPLKLIIEGLYSYQKSQEIDFTKLTESHLFGIFGSVGSGKSSILEAITFALYGETDKLNKRDNRAYNMMNLKSNSFFIDFEFELEDAKYKSVVKCKRNSKRYEDVKKVDRLFYKEQDGEWFPIEEREVHSEIGLTYENFKRTIIIPQGQFKEFLELGDTERTKMMKQLFNLGKYDLLDKVKPLMNKNLEELNKLRGQLEQLGDVNIDDFKKIEEQLRQLVKEIDAVTKDFKLVDKQVQELENVKNLKEKEQKVNKRLFELKTREQSFKLLEEKLKDYDFCFKTFKYIISDIERLKASVKSIKIDILNKRRLEKDNLALLEENNKKFVFVKKDYDEREKIKKNIEELNIILDILSLKREEKTFLKHVERLDKEVKDRELNLEKGREFVKELMATLEKEKKDIPDILKLNEIKQWHDDFARLSKEKKKLSDSVFSAEKDIKEIKTKAVEHYMGEVHSSLPKTVIVALDKRKKVLSESIKPIDDKIDSYSIQLELEKYAARLEDGKSCPLCGSLEHPNIMISKQVSSLLSKCKGDRNIINKEIDLIDKNKLVLQDYSSRIELKEEAIIIQKADLKATSEEMKKLSESFKWDICKTKEDLDKAFAAYKTQKTLIDKNEKFLTAGNKRLDVLAKEFDEKSKEITLVQTKLVTCKTKLETISTKLSVLKFEDYLEKENSDIVKESKNLELRYKQIEALYNKMTANIEFLDGKQNELKGLIKANSDVLKKDEDALLVASEKLKTSLENTKYENEQKVKEILLQNIDTERERVRLDQYVKAVSNAKNELATLKDELKDKLYDEKKHVELREKRTGLLSKKDEKIAEKGKMQGSLEKMKKDLDKLKLLKKRENDLGVREADLKVLYSLFTSNKFVNYVSSVYLRNLCNAANDRFYKLTGQKLSLEITENNNFQVRDFMNGGNVRSVKTLSGGQSFQASLSLALALTDSIQKFTKSKQNFFFLDEGFGSLDKGALATVFDALKSLKKENRVVGVISHVEELQQEMGVYVKVVNDVERGSLVKFSWEE